MINNDFENKKLKSSFTSLGVWAFSIGTSIGWGSFIVTCNTYLQKSGVLGTVFGMLIGMAVIMFITWNLQYMIQNSPDAGGIYTFEKRIGGIDFGFLAAWFVLLCYLAVLWANITSVPLFARFFLGDTFQIGFHYNIFGYEVWFGEALLSICAVLLVGILCSRSSRMANNVMSISALVFGAGFTICALFAVFRHDASFSYSPLYIEGSSSFAQIIRIAAISPWAFIGFENVSHFSEEYAFPVKKIKSILISSVIITTLLYILVSVLSVSAYPPEYESWLAYISDMGNLSGLKAVPAFYAAEHYLGQTGVTILMFALFSVILTSLIGNLMALSRLLYAAGRDGEAPAALAKLNKDSIPENAIYLVIALSVFIPFLGRTAIGWIVDVTTLGATIIYAMISYAVYMDAKKKGRKTEIYTGIIGFILMGIFLLLLLIPGLLPFQAMETESYALFITWAVLGLIYFRKLISKENNQEYVQHIVVWIILLVLILFASMMWVSRATENAANNAVQNIFEYHQNHPAHDSSEYDIEHRVEFLQEQAKQISRTNTLYTGVSLVLFTLCMTIMFNNYRHTRRLGERLTVAQEEARVAQQIAELKESITSLLNNMPAMSFSKDAKTGVYLACNQAFAEYAHKESPEGVVGLTDAEIFDPKTAKHFIEDDRMALSMEKPYVFFEDVPDAAGNQKQFMTTKFKYVDTYGRQCILGMCEDITDKISMQRENESTKEAYEKAMSTGLIFTRIAQSMARGYTDIFYVNTETGEFTEYKTNSENGMLSETSHGENFFDESKKLADQYIYPDDRDSFKNTFEKNNLLDSLDRNSSLISTYRMITKNGPIYVTIKVSRLEDDDKFIIIGISDTDEQIKQQKAAERIKEEQIAYARINALSGDFLCIYIVVPETNRYREYSSSPGFDALDLPKEGLDFFKTSRELIRNFIYPEDLERFLSLFTKEGIISEIERSGIFSMTYRLLIENKPTYVRLKAAMVEEKEGLRLIVGIIDIDSHVRQEEEYARRLSLAQTKASIDALTKVKNRHAYLDAEELLDRQISEKEISDFAITILDVNDLKKINDTKGHQAGDQYLVNACGIICNIFKHSPVYRIGGDEFAVISQGQDYEYIDTLIETINENNQDSISNGGIVIACGMAKYNGEDCVAPVFEIADQRMYENKNELKSKTLS